jgi:hypothetical protein
MCCLLLYLQPQQGAQVTQQAQKQDPKCFSKAAAAKARQSCYQQKQEQVPSPATSGASSSSTFGQAQQ